MRTNVTRLTGCIAIFIITMCLNCVVSFAQACPTGCRVWSDGCNDCSCVNGRVDSCTQRLCERNRPARCLDPPAPATTVRVITQQRRSECQAYAHRAVSEFRELWNAGCRCKNARWHNDYNKHYQWCTTLQASGNETPEHNARIQGVASCRAGRPPC